MMSTRLVAALALLVLPTGMLAQQRAPSAKSVFTQTAVLAGGCFWGVEAVYEHTKGIVDVVSGFAGGDRTAASSGKAPAAESVRITYDPSRITYEQILEIFFSVVHDPTQLNRQGPDVGPQYRSAIFFSDPKQETAAKAYIARLSKAKAFPKPIVTEVSPLGAFRVAEDYHQDFVANNPKDPYVVYHDLPRLARYKSSYPAFFVAR
jgi:peptide-methionine (S)-S-oxide reductase